MWVTVRPQQCEWSPLPPPVPRLTVLFRSLQLATILTGIFLTAVVLIRNPPLAIMIGTLMVSVLSFSPDNDRWSFGVHSDTLVTFYNAVICSIIVYGAVCWGGNISKFDRGRLEKIVKKTPTGHVVGMPSDSFKTLYAKRPFKKLMQILNDPTHPMRYCFDSRRSNRSGRLLLPKTNTNLYKASFLPSALSVFNENYNSH